MAQFSIEGIDELIQYLERLGKLETVAPKMLEEAVPILKEEVVRQATPHWETGDMVESIESTGAMIGKSGVYYICVRPTGYASNAKKWQYARSKGGRRAGKRQKVRNMEKLVWLEFGAKGRAATPVLTTAVLNACPEVIRKMQEVFEREAGRT